MGLYLLFALGLFLLVFKALLEFVLVFLRLGRECLILELVLLYHLALLVNLFLQRLGDFHHVVVVVINVGQSVLNISLKVLQTEVALVQSNVKRGDLANLLGDSLTRLSCALQ